MGKSAAGTGFGSSEGAAMIGDRNDQISNRDGCAPVSVSFIPRFRSLSGKPRSGEMFIEKAGPIET